MPAACFSKMFSSRDDCKAILAVQKGSIIASNKQQQLCIISWLAIDVTPEQIPTKRGGRKQGFIYF